MAERWPLLNWPRRFPLIHEPATLYGNGGSQVVFLAQVAEGCGITFDGMAQFRHRRFGPRHCWRGGRFVVLRQDLDTWLGRPWRSGEEAMLTELQHTHPADFLKPKARCSLEQIGKAQRQKP